MTSTKITPLFSRDTCADCGRAIIYLDIPGCRVAVEREVVEVGGDHLLFEKHHCGRKPLKGGLPT